MTSKYFFMKGLLCLLISMFLLSGCDLQQKEQALKKKEMELNQKEQELIAREKTLEFKEQELAKKLQRFDTLAKDSAFIQNPTIPGVWSTKMTCVETTCPGSAVGDVKTEQWIISYEANHVIARVMAGDKLTRVYTGSFNGSTIELSLETQPTASEPATRMLIRLNIKNPNSMEGQREIVRDDCRVVYSIQMEKTK
jgi:hypothetical protein